MKYEKNRKIFGLDEFTFLKYIKLLIIPIIIIILIIIFLSLNLSFKQKKSKKIENNLTTSKSEFKPTDKLRLNDNEAINNLFLEYQKARIQGDLSKLSSLFLNSEENNLDSEELKNKLSEAAKLFEGFTSDTEIYLADGKAVGEYVALQK